MYITFNELRQLKHRLPTGSISKIAQQLQLEEQTVRNYFGAKKFVDGSIVAFHQEQGPDGGIVLLDDDTIYQAAMNILNSSSAN